MLTYSVDGMGVVKNVVRQTWAEEDFTGSYIGGTVEDRVYCVDPVDNGHFEYSGPIGIENVADEFLPYCLSIQWPGVDTCTLKQPRAQSGHMGGGVGGSYSCPNGVFGSGAVFQMERTAAGIAARYELSIFGTYKGRTIQCESFGRFVGVRR